MTGLRKLLAAGAVALALAAPLAAPLAAQAQAVAPLGWNPNLPNGSQITDTASGTIKFCNAGCSNNFTAQASGSGNVTFGGSIVSAGDVGAGNFNNFYWTTRGSIGATADGVIILRNNAQTNTASLTIGASHLLTSNGQIVALGTATNDSACAGCVGEYGSASVAQGSATALVTATAKDVTSVSLTAGDYEVEFDGGFISGAGASTTYTSCWVSTTSATFPGLGGEGTVLIYQNVPAGQAAEITTGHKRISLSATTTVYGSCQSAFSGGTESAFGVLRWRRPR